MEKPILEKFGISENSLNVLSLFEKRLKVFKSFLFYTISSICIVLFFRIITYFISNEWVLLNYLLGATLIILIVLLILLHQFKTNGYIEMTYNGSARIININSEQAAKIRNALELYNNELINYNKYLYDEEEKKITEKRKKLEIERREWEPFAVIPSKENPNQKRIIYRSSRQGIGKYSRLAWMPTRIEPIKSRVIYSEYMRSPEWRIKRERVLSFRGRQCEKCGCNDLTQLRVHHITYDRLGNEDMKDLRILCNDCHHKVHNLFDLQGRYTGLKYLPNNPYKEAIERDNKKLLQQKINDLRSIKKLGIIPIDYILWASIGINFFLNGLWIMLLSLLGVVLLDRFYDSLPYTFHNAKKILSVIGYCVYSLVCIIILLGIIPYFYYKNHL